MNTKIEKDKIQSGFNCPTIGSAIPEDCELVKSDDDLWILKKKKEAIKDE